MEKNKRSRNEVFTEEGIPARIIEEQMNMNEYLTTINEPSDNKEITPTEGIPERITEEKMNMNDYLTPINEASDKITPPEGIRGNINTIENENLNDYATVNYEELDNNKVATTTDTKQQSSRLVWF